MSRVLVAGVGYRNLRDHSVGGVVIDRLAERRWETDVAVEDLSFNPIAVVQRLEDDAPDRRFDRAIFVSAAPRGRVPGTVTAYCWDGVLPAAEEIHQAVCDAVTGVIHLDNTLIVARHFNALPDDLIVIEVEPLAHEFGDTLSQPVADAVERVCELVTAFVSHESAVGELPRAPLGGLDLPVPVTPTEWRRL